MNIITEQMVRDRVDLVTAFAAIEESYKLFSLGKTTTPATTSMPVNDGTFYSFPAHINGSPIFISKQATDYRKNSTIGLPTVHPYILVFNSATGVLDSIIEGRYFAAVRTALSSAVGVKHLLSRKPQCLAILGSGVQGQSHARILPSIFKDIQQVFIYSPTREHREAAVKELRKTTSAHIDAVSDPDEAIAHADVIITATSSRKPVFHAHAVQEGALIIGVGAMKSDQEIPPEIMSRAAIVVDSEANIPMYDEINKTKELGLPVRIVGDIGLVVCGQRRINKQATIVFKHHGLPVTDAALAETIASSPA